MPNLSIKDVPETWAEVLRQRALRHHRSLQGELMAILEQAVAAPTAQSAREGGAEARWPVLRQGAKSLGQVRAELLARYPVAIDKQVSSVALIREARDSR